MRKLLFLVPVLGLTACMSPRDSCINDAQRQLSLIDSQIATARGNIERGYALASVQDVRVIRTTCTGTNQDGSTFTFPCQETRTVDRQEPVAINVSEERAKLADLQQRRGPLATATNARIEQCIAIHPE